MTDPTILVATMAAAGAVAAGATALSRPRLALAILFLLASFSRATLETPLGTMRPEMPAIAVVALVLLAGGRFSALRGVPRTILAMALAFGLFLGVLALSSATVAPGTAQSLRMVAWFSVSMVGGVVAFILMRARPVESIGPFAFAGATMGFAGILAAGAFLVAGPGFDLGIQDANSIVPRVYALGWETNLYSSFLGMSAFFALESARGTRRIAGLAGLALVLIGFALGITRGAYAGLAVGILAYGIVRVAMERRPADLPRLGAIAGAFLVVGIAASGVLLPNNLQRASPGTGVGQVPSGSPGATSGTVSSSGSPNSSGSPGVTTTPGPPIPTPTPLPSITLNLYPDTISFRLERVPIALDDLRRSPLIGFGAEAFGQEHPDRYAGPGPDHIAIMAVVVPYEAGLIGAAGLATGFLLLLGSLWRAARRASVVADWRTVGAVAAFIGSLVSILVAYQVTNALQFAVNWMVIGAAAALAAREPSPDAALAAREPSPDA